MAAGCGFDATDWTLLELDHNGVDSDVDRYGVGIPARYAVTLQRHESNLYTAPLDLQAVVDDPGIVEIDIGEKIVVEGQSSEYEAIAMTLRPLTAGKTRIRLLSESTEEVHSFTADVREPTFDTFVVWGRYGDSESLRESKLATQVTAFAGNELEVWPRYIDGDDPAPEAGLAVYGSLPMSILEASADATLSDHILQLPADVGQTVLAVNGTADELTIHAVAPDAIARFELLTSGKETELDGVDVTITYSELAPIAIFDGDHLTMQEGKRTAMRVLMLDASGEQIWGLPAEPLRVETDGEIMAFFSSSVEPVVAEMTTNRDIALASQRSGQTMITITSPSGYSKTITVDVVAVVEDGQ